MKKSLTIVLFFAYAFCSQAQGLQDPESIHFHKDNLKSPQFDGIRFMEQEAWKPSGKTGLRTFQTNNGSSSFDKLDSLLTSTWVDSLGEYVESVTYYTYNDQGLNAQSEQFLKTENGLEITDRYEHIYDEKGRDSLRFSYEWDAGQEKLVETRKYEYGFDDSGNSTLWARYEWDGELNDWIGVNKYIAGYNEAGWEILSTSYEWNSDANDWIASGKTEYIRDENGNVLQHISSNWNPDINDFEGSYKFLHQYDEEGSLVLILFYDWQTDDWLLTQKNEYEYDSLFRLNGEKVANREVQYGFAEFDSTWSYNYESRTTIEQEGDTSVVLSQESRDQWSTWENYSLNKYRFDDQGNTTLNESYFWNSTMGDWRGTLAREYEYNERGRLTSFTRYLWDEDESGWYVSRENTYYYNVYFEPIKEIPAQTVTFGETLALSVFEYFKLTDNRTLTYQTATQNTGVLSVSVKDNQVLINSLENTEGTDSVTLTIHLTSEDSVVTGFRVNTLEGEEVEETLLGLESPAINAVYPVPAQSRLHIREGLFNDGSQWQIIDTSGKALGNGRVTNGPIKLEKYQTGIYLINIVDGQQVKTYRFMKE